MTDTLLTVAEVARRLGISERSTRRMCAEGELPAIRVGKRLWRIYPDFEQHLAQQHLAQQHSAEQDPSAESF